MRHRGEAGAGGAGLMTKLSSGLVVYGLLIGLAVAGCGKAGDGTPAIALDWRIEPTPPRIGPASVHFTLQDTVAGEPVAGAQVHLEGNMSHPGMAPSLADAIEVKAGNYKADLDFTMAGDWYLLFDIRLPDGRQVERKVDVRGVWASSK